MNLRGKNLDFLVVLWLFLVIGCANAGPEEVGVVTFLKGKGVINRGETKIDLTVDSPIFREDVIQTESKSKVRVVFFSKDLMGSKVVGPETRFEVAGFAKEKSDSHSIKDIASELFQTFAKSPPDTSHVSVTRGPLPGIICYPRGTHIGPISHFVFFPQLSATKYSITLTYEDQGLIEEKYETEKTIFSCPKPLKPGVSYILFVEAHGKDGSVGMATSTFSWVLKEKFEKIYNDLIEVEKEFSEDDDPTLYLAKGNYLLKRKLPSDAFFQFLSYAKSFPKSSVARGRIIWALSETNFQFGKTSDSEEKSNAKFVQDLIQSSSE